MKALLTLNPVETDRGCIHSFRGALFYSLIVLFVFLGVSNLYATALTNDVFDYTAGSLLKDSAPWSFAGNASDSPVVQSGSLYYSDLKTSQGNRIAIKQGIALNNFSSIYITHTSGSYPANTALYASFILNVVDLANLTTSNTKELIALYSVGSDNCMLLRLNSTDTNRFDIGIGYNNSSSRMVWDTNGGSGYSAGQDMLIVMGTADASVNSISTGFDLWVNPDVSSGLGMPTITAGWRSDVTRTTRFYIFPQGSTTGSTGAQVDIDELRIGTTEADVIPEDTLSVETDVSSISVDEGGSNSFQVKLSSPVQGLTTVGVSRVSGDVDISISSGSNLVFNSTNWSSWQVVTLSAAEDGDVLNGSASIECAIMGGASTSVTATENENDFPSILTSGSSLEVTEGSTGVFNVKLSNQPGSSVTVSVARVSGDADITVQSGASLVFSTSSWDTWSLVTLSAAVDSDNQDGSATISCSSPGLTGADVTALEDDTNIVLAVGSENIRIVDYGNDVGEGYYQSPVVRGPTADYDGDGNADDGMTYRPYYWTNRFNPAAILYDEEAPSAILYGGLTGYFKDSTTDSFTEGMINENHSMRDDFNMMANATGQAMEPKIAGLWFWKKEDFLNGGANHTVTFDANSMVVPHISRYWDGVTVGRWVVRDGNQFYISQKTFGDYSTEIGRSAGTQTSYILRPTETLWAEYNPGEPYPVTFDAGQATFSSHIFTDVTAVGFYAAKDNFNEEGVAVKWHSFECYARVSNPETNSLQTTMVEIPSGSFQNNGTGTVYSVPSFSMGETEVSYALWQKIYKWANSGQYCFDLNPGYITDKDGDMGSMDVGNNFHRADEPVTDITWYDAIAWCNALSEYEGKAPCYYTDSSLTNVLRQVKNRDYPNLATNKFDVYVNWHADGYRLPTALEWVYAAEAGGSLNTNATHAWTSLNSTNRTQAVGSLSTNSWGLYDMIGNVWEFTWDADGDHFAPSAVDTHLVLGGGFTYPADPTTNSIMAQAYEPYAGNFMTGFRLVRSTNGPVSPEYHLATGNAPVWTLIEGQSVSPAISGTVESVSADLVYLSGTNAYPDTAETDSLAFWRDSDDAFVTITPFYASKYEISYRKWRSVFQWAVNHGYVFDRDGDMGSMDWKVGSHSHRSDEPVTDIGWYDAILWCNALSEYEGKVPCYYADSNRTQVIKMASHWRVQQEQRPEGNVRPVAETVTPIYTRWENDGYRLPTLSEWKVMYRDGDPSASLNYPWSGEDIADGDLYGWVEENGGHTTHAVGTKSANSYGLYNLVGNVMEWVWDWPADDYYRSHNPKGSDTPNYLFGKAVCGSSFGSEPVKVTEYHRRLESESRTYVGLRVVRCALNEHPENQSFSPPTVLHVNTNDYDELTGRTFRNGLWRTGKFETPNAATYVGTNWTFNTGGPVQSSPIVVDGILYMGSDDGFMYALDVNDGSEIWKTLLDGEVRSTATIADGSVFVGSDNGTLYSLNQTDGSIQWTYSIGSFPLDQATAYAYGHVFVGAGGYNKMPYVGINATTGEEAWRYRLMNANEGPGGVTIVGTNILMYGSDNKYWCADIQTEYPNWVNVGVHSDSSIALLDKDTFIHLFSYNLYCGDVTTGTKHWQKILGGGLTSRPESSPAVGLVDIGAGIMTNVVYFGHDVLTNFFAINAHDGSTLWTYPMTDRVDSSPALVDDRIYVGCDDGYLYAFDAASNASSQVIWAFKTDGEVNSSPCVDSNGVVYVGSDDGRIYALANQSDVGILVDADPLVVYEGSNNSLQVRLSAQPSSSVNVTVSRISGDSDLTVSGGSTLTFTTSDWDAAQSVTFAAAEDADESADLATFRLSASGVPNKDIVVQEDDNEAVFVLESSSVNVPEGSFGSVLLTLSDPPTSDVTVSVARVSGDADITVRGVDQSFVIAVANWSVGKSIRLDAAQDNDAASGLATIEVSSPSMTPISFTAIELEDDTLSIETDLSELSVMEGSTGNFRVRLASMPGSIVTVGVSRTSGDTNLTVQGGASLSFTTNDWNVYQTVTIAAAEEAGIDNGGAVFRCSANGLSNIDVTISEIDNDRPQPMTLSVRTNKLVSDVTRLGLNLEDGYYLANTLKERHAINFEGRNYRTIYQGGWLYTNGYAANLWNTNTFYTSGWNDVVTNGAVYQIITGEAKDNTGTFASISVKNVSGTDRLFFEFEQPIALASNGQGDIAIMINDNSRLSQGYLGKNGYWTGSDTVLITDDSPGNFGTVSAELDGQNGTIIRMPTAYDQLADPNGDWEIKLYARIASGAPTLTVDSSHSSATALPLSGTWQQRVVTQTVSGVTNLAWNNAHELFTLTAGGSGKVRVDDIQVSKLGQTKSAFFTDDFIDAMQILKPGIVRSLYMTGSISNNLADPVRQYSHTGASAVGSYEGTDIDYGKHTLTPHRLATLAAEIGAEPWMTVPSTITDSELEFFLEYLSGGTNTAGGRMRIDLGQLQPWTEVFDTIQVEFGNEAWNLGGGYIGFNGPDYWNDLISAGKTSANYRTNIFFTLGGWASSPSTTEDVMNNATNGDMVCIAPYMVNSSVTSNDIAAVLGSDEELWRWMLARPMNQIFDNGLYGHEPVMGRTQPEYTVYEFNYHTTRSGIQKDEINRFFGTSSHGISMANSMLSMLKKYGIRRQCYFAQAGSYEGVELWGSMHTARKGYERYRPDLLALAAINNVVAGDLIQTSHSDDWMFTSQGYFDTGYGTNSYPTLYSYAFQNGTTNGLVLFNYDLVFTQSVTLALSDFVENQQATRWSLDSTSFTADNDSASTLLDPLGVVLTETNITFDHMSTIAIAPAAVQVYKWVASSNPVAQVVVSAGQLLIAEGDSGSVTVSLSSAPAETVAVSASLIDQSNADFSITAGSQMVFGPTDWANAQTVTVTSASETNAINGSAVLRFTSLGRSDQEVLLTEDDHEADVQEAVPVLQFDFGGTLTTDMGWNNIDSVSIGAKVAGAVNKYGYATAIGLEVTDAFEIAHSGATATNLAYPISAQSDLFRVATADTQGVIRITGLDSAAVCTLKILSSYTQDFGSECGVTVNGSRQVVDSYNNQSLLVVSNVMADASGWITVAIDNDGSGVGAINLLELEYLTLPNAPANLSSDNASDGVVTTNRGHTFSWDAPTNVTVAGYSYAMDAEPDNTVDTTGTGSSTFADMEYGVHTFKVKAQSSTGAWSAPADFTLVISATAGPPIAPGSFASTGQTNSTVDLSWTDPSDVESGFEIERSPAGQASWAGVALPAANATAWIDTDVSAGTSYDYRIRTLSIVGTSAWSSVVSATVPSSGGGGGYYGSKTLLFDFGTAAYETVGNWNNISSYSASSGVSNVVDSNGVQTIMALTLTNAAQWANTDGVTTNVLYPESAQRDYIRVNSVDDTAWMQLTGLDTNVTYTFTFFASSPDIYNPHTRYTIGVNSVVLNPELNTSNTVQIVDVQPDASGSISIKMDRNGSGSGYLSVLQVDFTIAQPAVIETDVSSLSVTEGSSNSFQVKLSKQPVANTIVTVAHTAGDEDVIVASGASLLFTTNDWDQYQSVTLTATPDYDIDNGIATITCSSMGWTNTLVTATESDDDTIAVSGLRTMLFDFGSVAYVTTGNWNNISDYRLGFGVTNAVDSQGAVMDFDLMLTNAAQWSATDGVMTNALYPEAAQRDYIRVNSVDDTAWMQLTGLDTNLTYAFTFFASSPDVYNPHTRYTIGTSNVVLNPELNVSNTVQIVDVQPDVSGSISIKMDRNGSGSGYLSVLQMQYTVPGGIATPDILASGSSISVPEGSTGTFDVSLSSDPGASVTVTVANVNGDADITVQSGSSMIFDSGTWNIPQTVTLAAAEDMDVADGSATIRCSANGFQNVDVDATESDNDTLAIQPSTTSVSIGEGSTTVFDVELSHQPSASVTVTVANVNGDADITVQSGSSLIFDSGTWNIPQTVTLAAVEDMDVADGSATIRCSSTGLANVDLSVTEIDNDTLAIITSSSALSIPEGSNNTFTVELSHQPSGQITVGVSHFSGDADITVQSGVSLVFDGATWNVPQAVTLSAAEDADMTNGTAVIRSSSTGLSNMDVIATETDNDLTVSPDLRVTEYYLTTGDFSGTTATLLLNQDLADDYYILVRGSRAGDGGSHPDNDYARVTAVPGGKGDLLASGAANQITLGRFVADADWEGVVTVVECENSDSAAGFKLVDIVETSLTGTSGADTSAPWADLSRVVLFGGYRGGGAAFAQAAASSHHGVATYVRLHPSGTNMLNWSRNAAGETLMDAVMTTFVIEWGSEWNVQRVHVDGNNGGNGADVIGEYTTATISAVNRDNTWLWATGTRSDAGIGDCAEACLITLGDGVSQNASESTVAVGSEYSDAYDFDVYVLSHPAISVDHRFKTDGDSTGLDVAIAVDTTTAGARFGWVYNGVNGTGGAHPRSRFWARYTADDTITISRGYDGQAFPAWVQGVDLSGLND